MGSSAERAAPPGFALPRARPKAAAANASFHAASEIGEMISKCRYYWKPDGPVELGGHSKRVLAAGLTLADKHPQWPRKT
jgi:hypothetical protein